MLRFELKDEEEVQKTVHLNSNITHCYCSRYLEQNLAVLTPLCFYKTLVFKHISPCIVTFFITMVYLMCCLLWQRTVLYETLRTVSSRKNI